MTESTNEPVTGAPITAAKRPSNRKPKAASSDSGDSAAAIASAPARKPRAKAAKVQGTPVLATPDKQDAVVKKTPLERTTRASREKKESAPQPQPVAASSEGPAASKAASKPVSSSPRPRRVKGSEAAAKAPESPSAPTTQVSPLSAPAPEAIVSEGKPKARGRARKTSAVQGNEATDGHSSKALEPVAPPAPQPVTVSTEPVKKQYPVYVPLHLAKQMEQEGKPAPLAVAADAQQAAAIRAASYENRHGVSAPQSGGSGTAALAPAHPSRRDEHSRGHRSERMENSRDERGDSRQGGGQQQQQADRAERQDRPERNERNEQRHGRDRRDGKRDRHDRRRDGRSDDGRQRHSEDRGQGEHSRELPPPTPEELYDGEGIIEISGKGFGFLRDRGRNFVQSKADIFVSPEMVRRFNLRDGQWIKGSVRKSGLGQQMHEIQSVNGDAPEASKMQPMFEELTVINPSEPLMMATVPERYTTRIIDMVAPIGKGQRGLIVAPPRTGKTTLLQHIADAMMKNHPEVKLIMLLVDERPEEVTEIRHTVSKAEIMASSNDMDVRSHTRIAELAIERAKRLVEAGQDVFILLDSITRLGRAFNNAMTNGGRTMSGGIDARAMEIPRKLFAAARNTEEAGSLTIIATALIETGSRMDEIIFQEFKGTGNMELVLDRKIAEQRIYPAVDIFQSGTRREELLVPADTLQKIHFLRRGLSGCRPSDAIDRLLFYLKKFQTNEQMLKEIRG